MFPHKKATVVHFWEDETSKHVNCVVLLEYLYYRCLCQGRFVYVSLYRLKTHFKRTISHYSCKRFPLLFKQSHKSLKHMSSSPPRRNTNTPTREHFNQIICEKKIIIIIIMTNVIKSRKKDQTLLDFSCQLFIG